MYFPLFIDLSEKEILVIGAGHIASRRVRSLCGFAGRITVVAPQISDDFFVPDTDTKINTVTRCFTESDLEGKDLVLAATDDRELNRHIFELCRARCIPVNVCSDSELCDFQFPSIVENGAVVIGINASGRDHHLVKETRKRVESLFHDPQFKSKYE
ncbi:MAG: bifunctional precorrin-2 dehydrogenase/sirohydrochlorin ferrochelatase [Lachnospiraceae bacterium]|nr:bifunctional precorrin-2 dehydrogenase/sirohydrochlorin ferrochelatase [Lachnospiraceae bacterium]MCD7765801.1 bifunctional precorrin-2 dehydrogenase/sirohydrochlorin ferrochelatase [Lachnospiraceae bacterium]